MKKPTEILHFLASQDWLAPAPTTIAAGAFVSSAGGWAFVLSDSWKPVWIILGSMGLCFLVVPRILAFLNMGRDAREAELKAMEAKREAFRALAPTITEVLFHAEAGGDSPLRKKKKAHAAAFDLLLRLRGEFQITIPEEPYLLMYPPVCRHLYKIAECAHAGDLKAAQELEPADLF